MFEADAKRKLCPVITRPDTNALCKGSDCMFWIADDCGPKTVAASDRKSYDDAGWSTNNQIDEAGNLVFYRAVSGHCSQA